MGEDNSETLLSRYKAKNLDNHFPFTLANHDDAIISEGDAPHCIGRLGQLAHKVAGLQIPQLNSAVVASGHNVTVVELDAGDGIIVGTDAMDALASRHVKDNDASVRAARG